jgi:hypothetical protein
MGSIVPAPAQHLPSTCPAPAQAGSLMTVWELVAKLDGPRYIAGCHTRWHARNPTTGQGAE